MNTKPNDEMRSRLDKAFENDCASGAMATAHRRSTLIDWIAKQAASEVDRATADLQAENKALRERVEPRGAVVGFEQALMALQNTARSADDADANTALVILAELDRRSCQLDKATKRIAALRVVVNECGATGCIWDGHGNSCINDEPDDQAEWCLACRAKAALKEEG